MAIQNVLEIASNEDNLHKYQIRFSGKNKRIINLLSAGLA